MERLQRFRDDFEKRRLAKSGARGKDGFPRAPRSARVEGAQSGTRSLRTVGLSTFFMLEKPLRFRSLGGFRPRAFAGERGGLAAGPREVNPMGVTGP
jgi:hypothetical protein